MAELLEGIGHNIRRLRGERGWNQAELGFHADTSPSIISLIENGKRNPSTATLAKIAGALGVEVVELFPKASGRSSREPSLFNGLEEERRSETIKAIFELMERWHARRLAEVEDEASPHFRDPTSAALWIADTREEAQDFCEWLAEFIGNRPRTAQGVQEALELFFGALALDGPAKLGEMRLDDMAAPGELAARRMARAAAGFQASMERVQGLGKAVNG